MIESTLAIAIGQMLLSRIENAVFDSVVSHLRDHILPQLVETETQLDAMMGQLSEINAKIEMDLVRHLKAGLTFIRLGYWDEAIKRFIDADAIDNRSAIAKFWLGLLLFHSGKQAEGLQFFESSLDLNPYIAPLLAINQDVMDESLISCHRAHDRNIKKHLLWRREIEDAVGSISLCRRNLIVEAASSWKVTAYDISTGQKLWSIPYNLPMRLLFATPTFVVFYNSKHHDRFEFYSQHNGQFHSRMQPAYFKTVFCSDITRLQALPMFKRSNANLPLHNESFSEIQGETKHYKDATLLTDPWSTLEPQIKVENDWLLKKQYGTYISFDGLYCTDTLDESWEGTGIIQCFAR